MMAQNSRMSNASKKYVLVINQHGENRGDEAAMRAMISGLDKALGGAQFRVIVQFQDTSLELPFNENVMLLHMKMPYSHFLGLVLYAAFRRLGLKLTFMLSRETKNIIRSYENADIVISAPGGPYFGDIYYRHELVHWFYVWMTGLYRKPLFLYAPSAGPFRIGWLNAVRRYLFKTFDTLCVREEISRDHLSGLLGEDAEIHVTADSAIQQEIAPGNRAEYFDSERAELSDRFLVAVSAIEYRFPGDDEPKAAQKRYTNTLVRCLHHLHRREDCHFLFIPQLYGAAHSDVPYLEFLASRLPEDASTEIVDSSLDSDAQRRIFGMADICIASRYHPQIFAATANVPGVCIYYEHKALGFMSFLGLADFAFDIRSLDGDRLCEKLDDVIERRSELSALIADRIQPVRARARETTRLAASIFRQSQKKS